MLKHKSYKWEQERDSQIPSLVEWAFSLGCNGVMFDHAQENRIIVYKLRKKLLEKT